MATQGTALTRASLATPAGAVVSAPAGASVREPRSWPILMSPPMVRALLARQKRVTRRLDKRWLKVKAGDRIWVRETWRTWKKLDDKSPSEIAAQCLAAGYAKPWSKIEYTADGHISNSDAFDDGDPMGKTRVSIHLPRWGSRLLLEATEDARLERLHDMTEDEADAEGIIALDGETDDADLYRRAKEMRLDASDSLVWYAQLFDAINGAGSWDANPEVVRVAFRVIDSAGGAT